MEGIRAIQGRIMAIQQRIEGKDPSLDAAGKNAASKGLNATALSNTSNPLQSGTDFEAMLSSALGTTSGTTVTAPSPPQSELVNGQLPTSALSSLGVGNHSLKPDAAESFKRMNAAATLDGVHIGITDSYRDLPTQERLAKEKGLYKNGGLAAVPGTSQHGWGNAVDLDLDAKAQAWMRANGERFGFVEDVPREPWHWTFHG